MNLLPPVVVGPLSECSSGVRVEGQLIGATVNLFSNGTHVGSGIATWTDQVFPLNAGVILPSGANITATQTMSGVTSAQSDPPVNVQKKPPVIGNVGCKTHIYVCGECLWLDGMVPGAKVQITAGGILRGSGIAYDGSARIHLSSPIGPGDSLIAQQDACGTAGIPTLLPHPDSLQDRHHLPTLTVQDPLRACQRAVNMSGAIDGAQVTLTETPGFVESACFDLSSLWFPTPQLTLGSKVTAIQDMPKCEIHMSSNVVTVGPSTPVPPPVIIPPLCAGSKSVRITGLLPGSPVEIFENSTSLGIASANSSTFDFNLPVPLTSGALLTARQELCSNWSAPSNAVKVDPHPASLPTPVIASPLYNCGAMVHISNLRPNGTVYVYSTLLGAPIGSSPVSTTEADVMVSPLLIQGDHIYAMQYGCGMTSSKSAILEVLPTPTLGIPKVLDPVEDYMKSITVGNVIPGAHVDIYVNGSWRGSAIATAITVEVQILFGSLNIGDTVNARQIICGKITKSGEPTKVISHKGFYYLTQHFDEARTGWFPYETTLNVANVSSIRKRITYGVDGTIYAQPLYAHHINIPSRGAHNVVFVATENDTVYAFDADTNQPVLWTRSLIPPGEQVVNDTDIGGCNNIAPVIGITSTPVIDATTYTMYVVAKTKRVSGPSTTFHYRLHALDITTGIDRISPVEISGSVPGTGEPNDGHGHVVFDPHWHLNRPGLLLLNGVIYVGFGSHCDAHLESYHGWVFGYNASTLNKVGVFATTPDTPHGSASAAGIWQSGMGLAGDSSGFVYFTTGNGNLTANIPGGRDYGDAVIKLRNDFTVSDFFTPADQPILLAQDIDLGSGGVLIPPDPPAASNILHLLVTCGKDGNIFLINRNNMGKYNGPAGPDHVVQTIPLQPGVPITNQPGVWGGPAYYNGSQQQFIYYCGNGSHLRAYLFSGSALSFSHQSPTAFAGEGGATPNVSSNERISGTGIVWIINRSNPLRLQAFDATNLARIFDSDCGPWNNPNGGPFIEPTAIRGKVYVPSDGELTIFGL